MSIETVKPSLNGLRARIARWVQMCFGEACLTDRHERALRLVEEAIELGQAEGVSKDFVERILHRVYSRPVGESVQEAGGVGVTFLAWTYAADVDPMMVMTREVLRVEAKGPEYFRKKQQDKANAGTARPPEEM